jgi:hypothetical protein
MGWSTFQSPPTIHNGVRASNIPGHIYEGQKGRDSPHHQVTALWLPKSWRYPHKSSISIRIFHCKASILGYPHYLGNSHIHIMLCSWEWFSSNKQESMGNCLGYIMGIQVKVPAKNLWVKGLFTTNEGILTNVVSPISHKASTIHVY